MKDILLSGAAGFIVGVILTAIFHSRIGAELAALHNRLDAWESLGKVEAQKVKTAGEQVVGAAKSLTK